MLTNKEMTIIKVSLATGGSVITIQATPLKSKRVRESYFNSKPIPAPGLDFFIFSKSEGKKQYFCS